MRKEEGERERGGEGRSEEGKGGRGGGEGGKEERREEEEEEEEKGITHYHVLLLKEGEVTGLVQFACCRSCWEGERQEEEEQEEEGEGKEAGN